MINWEEQYIIGSISSWHLQHVNKLLVEWYPALVSGEPVSGKTIFVPLCGKCVDLKWLYDQGLTVIGVEFARKAIIEFFNEHSIDFNVENFENYDVYVSNDGRLKVFRSDIFFLDESHYGEKFDYIWDRGSLCALEKENQEKYVHLILNLMKKSFSGLLEAFEYDDNLHNGPPYPLFKQDLARLHGENVTFKELSRLSIKEADHEPFGADETTILYKFWRK